MWNALPWESPRWNGRRWPLSDTVSSCLEHVGAMIPVSHLSGNYFQVFGKTRIWDEISKVRVREREGCCFHEVEVV